ncbi:NAD(P)-dependent oxidoreductase [uncultured Paludibaculum sp.]|uniref:NAD-dependent epimerase/dehydratase family protein n=1 Tax=uncultured Paludibaculum sp. TaxID=1765020 RepID=UPI002AABE86F|nr:NAD(P)-dependent oxidoreductase [uncultured Paludibaculum sp.]
MIRTEDQLEDELSTPSHEDVASVKDLRGPILILGAAGKMGPSLAHRLKRALEAGGNPAKVMAVSRFSSEGSRAQFESWGISTIPCDMLVPGALVHLPDAENIIYMAARKFGSSGNPSLTWAINAFLPGLVMCRYQGARIAAFSSGNVYPLVPVESGGATEQTPPLPLGEYAQSVLARERIFEHSTLEWGTRVALIRLNYAVELRYGVLVDIGRKVLAGTPIDVTMGHVNVVWQGDANSVAIQLLARCASPAFILNVTGPETLRVRDIAQEFARHLGRPVEFQGAEAPTALLNNAALCHSMFGRPRVSVSQMIEWIAHWIHQDGRQLNKPTHFENREGRF